MIQERYAAEILPIVEAQMKEVEGQGRQFIFQKDNDNSHGTKIQENIARLKKDHMELDYIDDWPSNSPDLNPIETAWRILKSRVKLRRSASPQEPWKAIEEVWKEITLDKINEAILGSKKTLIGTCI